MSTYKIVNNVNEISLNRCWAVATKFNSRDRVIDGNQIGSDYQGRQYRIVEKRERSFSNWERIGRGFLGTLAAICTLALALFFSQFVRNLFTRSKETIRFVVLEEQTSIQSQFIDAVISGSPQSYEQAKRLLEEMKQKEIVLSGGELSIQRAFERQIEEKGDGLIFEYEEFVQIKGDLKIKFLTGGSPTGSSWAIRNAPEGIF